MCTRPVPSSIDTSAHGMTRCSTPACDSSPSNGPYSGLLPAPRRGPCAPACGRDSARARPSRRTRAGYSRRPGRPRPPRSLVASTASWSDCERLARAPEQRQADEKRWMGQLGVRVDAARDATTTFRSEGTTASRGPLGRASRARARSSGSARCTRCWCPRTCSSRCPSPSTCRGAWTAR